MDDMNTTKKTRTSKKRASKKKVAAKRGHSSTTRTTHESRAQQEQARDNVHMVDFDPLAFEESGPLPEIPARDGYVQRWVRAAIRNESDARNLSTRSRRGWTPRPADTVDKAYQHMFVFNESMGGIIGTHDLVLMERPVEIHRKAEQIEAKKRRDLERAVKSNLFREHKNIGGSSSGFTAPSDESTARVERGRSPQIADD
jgi:hypothetical protein